MSLEEDDDEEFATNYMKCGMNMSLRTKCEEDYENQSKSLSVQFIVG